MFFWSLDMLALHRWQSIVTTPGWPVCLAAILGAVCRSWAMFVTCLVVRVALWSRDRYSLRQKKPDSFATMCTECPVRVLCVLGSGGHTMEMIEVVKEWEPRRFFCNFVIADTDSTSENKLKKTLMQMSAFRFYEQKFGSAYNTHKIPRAREVGQSFFTSIFTTIYASLHCLVLTFRTMPNLVLVNGPGTCVPVVLMALLSDLILGKRVSIVFIESFCRTRTLSMTGKLLYPLADRVVVHHKKLTESYPKCEYLGCIY